MHGILLITELLIAELHFADRGGAESLQNTLLAEKYIASSSFVRMAVSSDTDQVLIR